MLLCSGESLLLLLPSNGEELSSRSRRKCSSMSKFPDMARFPIASRVSKASGLGKKCGNKRVKSVEKFGNPGLDAVIGEC